MTATAKKLTTEDAIANNRNKEGKNVHENMKHCVPKVTGETNQNYNKRTRNN